MMRTNVLKLMEQSSHPLRPRLTANLEFQINVCPGDEDQLVGDGKWSDGSQTWNNVRIPFDAASNPHYTDYVPKFALPDHAMLIGTTWFDWVKRESVGFMFDFDSNDGHKGGLTDEQLQEVVERASELDYVSIVKSKSGNGYHVYVFMADGHRPKAKNHGEHAEYARAVLKKMEDDTGYDFTSKIDVFGGNAWVWTAEPNEDSFKEIKRASRDLKADELPPVPPKPQKRKSHHFVSDAHELEAEHEAHFKWMCDNGFPCHFEDGILKSAHTAGFKALHHALNLSGIFETISGGTDLSKGNCMAFPRPNGQWLVLRFGRGITEAETWRQDRLGHTTCLFNSPVDFDTAFASATPYAGDFYTFETEEQSERAFELLGVKLDIPERLRGRDPEFKRVKQGISVKIPANTGDRPEDAAGWRLYRNTWNKIIKVTLPETPLPETDHVVRRLTSQGKAVAWCQFTNLRDWVDEEKGNCHLRLRDVFNMSSDQANLALGRAVGKPWELVNVPFGPEYLEGRRWNRDAAQFKVQPVEGETCYWDKVLSHCGAGLNDAVQNDPWCQDNGVQDGAAYLFLWLASMLQKPFQHLPYLFLFSEESEFGMEEQSTGKSTLHEQFSRCVLTKGYVKADTVLVNEQGFNGEIESAILCAVEETDVNKGKARNRIKEYITADDISIHRKGGTPYMAQNATHWIQCANRQSYCPVLDGDSRIVVIEVQPLLEPIPAKELHAALEREAPAFLHKLLNLRLPPPHPEFSRVYLPVLSTTAKRQAASRNRDQRLTKLIHQIQSATKELKLWDVTSKDIKRLIGSDKSPSAIGRALNNVQIRAALDDLGLAVTDRLKDGCKQYTVAPTWVLEDDVERIRSKVQSGDWSVTDDAGVEISADDVEATLPEWESRYTN